MTRKEIHRVLAEQLRSCDLSVEQEEIDGDISRLRWSDQPGSTSFVVLESRSGALAVGMAVRHEAIVEAWREVYDVDEAWMPWRAMHSHAGGLRAFGEDVDLAAADVGRIAADGPELRRIGEVIVGDAVPFLRSIADLRGLLAEYEAGNPLLTITSDTAASIATAYAIHGEPDKAEAVIDRRLRGKAYGRPLLDWLHDREAGAPSGPRDRRGGEPGGESGTGPGRG